MDISFTWSNCAKITNPEFQELCSLPPGIDGSKLPYFHSLLCQWATSFTPACNWVVVIEPQNPTYLRQQITETVPNVLEPSKAQKWDIVSGYDNTFNEFTQSTIGCIFAEGYRGGEEGLAIESSMGNRGFITSALTQPRTVAHNFDLTFRETNSSFVDSVFKPWSILTAYKGLVARPQSESIKSTVTIYELANPTYSCENSIVRKVTTYYDCAPIKIAGIDLNQETMIIKHSVSFAFNTYSIKAL